jgi:hypothetical protein
MANIGPRFRSVLERKRTYYVWITSSTIWIRSFEYYREHRLKPTGNFIMLRAENKYKVLAMAEIYQVNINSNEVTQ